MNFKEFQSHALVNVRKDYDVLEHYVPKLFTEVAELVDAFMRPKVYGAELDSTNLIEEVGDFYWYYANIFRITEETYRRQPEMQFEDMFQASISAGARAGAMLDCWLQHDYYAAHDIPGEATGNLLLNLLDCVREIELRLLFILRCLDATQEDAWAANVRKLKKRYPDGYNPADALSRDLTAERKALEDE